MKFNLINLRDILEVPFFGGIIFYLSSIKKKNFLENVLLLSALSFLFFDLYIVLNSMKKIKENEENQNLNEENFYENEVEKFEEEEQLDYFIPSDSFKGKIENYVFTTRNEGTGYYLDEQN